MELLAGLLDIVLRLDVHLGALVRDYGAWVYAILFAVIFAETGLVVTPFLPGDSLLFVAGALAALGGLDVHLLVALLVAAAILGNTTNYAIGRWLGRRFFDEGGSRWVKREHLDRTHAFYERYGGAAVVISRFLPIIRTYVPFVAGLAQHELRALHGLQRRRRRPVGRLARLRGLLLREPPLGARQPLPHHRRDHRA